MSTVFICVQIFGKVQVNLFAEASQAIEDSVLFPGRTGQDSISKHENRLGLTVLKLYYSICLSFSNASSSSGSWQIPIRAESLFQTDGGIGQTHLGYSTRACGFKLLEIIKGTVQINIGT